MTDFEQEIEARLDLFQHLTGKGNVKDSNRTLYEIVRLLLGMINHHKATEPVAPVLPLEPTQTALCGAPQASEASVVEPAVAASLTVSDTPDTTMLPTDRHVVHQPPLHSEVMEHSSAQSSIRPAVHAPHGFTAAGNVRRIRNRKTVK